MMKGASPSRPLLVLCPLPDEVLGDLARTFDVTQLPATDHAGSAGILAAARGQQVVLTSVNVPLDAETIAQLPDSVTAIATYSVGLDHIDLAAARAREISVFNTPDVLTPSVAEVAVFLMLGAARRATESIELVRSSRWTGWTARQLNGIELAGKEVGILGMGRIGRAIAARARGFGMTVAYSNRTRLAAELEQAARYHADPAEMLAQIDVLVLACPSTAETRGFLNRDRLERLRRGAIVVNVARGDLVVDDALVDALASGQVYAAGLDVFNNEPQLDSRYLTLPNVFMLPHIGSSTVEARRRMAAALIEGLGEWYGGGSPANRVV